MSRCSGGCCSSSFVQPTKIARRPYHDRRAAQVTMAVMHSIATPSRRRTIHTDAFAIVIGRALPAMLCMVLVAFVPSAASAACPSTRPAFQTLRYEEDYSFLRDPDCRTDVWDRIKYRSEEHTSELQSQSISYAVFCLKKKKIQQRNYKFHK